MASMAWKAVLVVLTAAVMLEFSFPAGAAELTSRAEPSSWTLNHRAVAAHHRQLKQVRFGINYTSVEATLDSCSNTQDLNSSVYLDYLPTCKLAPNTTCGSIPSSIYPYAACCPPSANLTSGADCSFQALPYDPYFKCPSDRLRVCCHSFYCSRYPVNSLFSTSEVSRSCSSDVPDAFCCNSTIFPLDSCTGALSGSTDSCQSSRYLSCCPKGVSAVLNASTADYPERIQGSTTASADEIAAFKTCGRD